MKKILLLLLLGCAPAWAIETDAQHAIVMDGQTGAILYAKQADEVMYPASMTKMMTAYMLFDALKSGQKLLSDTFHVSEEAWRKGGSKMFVQLGTDITIEDLMRGIIIQSGNDASIVVAEGMAGSESQFAVMMTEKAHELDMKNSNFKNATGWPDDDHVTTAHDLALLAHHTIKNFPEYYPIYAEREFVYHDIVQHNRNLLLARNIGIDGLKTGHTEAAGYGITISGMQDGRRVHVVVGGLQSEKARADEAQKLYQYGFANFTNKTPQDIVLGAIPLWYGAKDAIDVTYGAPITVPRTQIQNATLELTLDKAVVAPIKKGAVLGKVTFTVDGLSAQTVPLLAAESVKKSGFLKQLITNVEKLTSGT